MRFEREEVRQAVFAAKDVGDHEDDRRQEPDLEKVHRVAGVLIDDQVIGDAGEPRHCQDHGKVSQQERAQKRGPRQCRPPPQELACVNSGAKCVRLMEIHGQPRSWTRRCPLRTPLLCRNGTSGALCPDRSEKRATDVPSGGRRELRRLRKRASPVFRKQRPASPRKSQDAFRSKDRNARQRPDQINP